MSARRRLPAWVGDLLIALVIFAAGAWVGNGYTNASRAAGRTPMFYQQYFEPAVMLACGRGFAISVPAPVPALQDFLNQTVDSFSCDKIPADQRVRSDGVFQWAMFDLMALVGMCWRIFGVSWSRLAPVHGLLFGSVVAMAYGVFRCGMGRVLAVLCACALMVSSVHLLNLPHLRDYGKAPFVLAHVLILAWLLTRELRPWQRLALAAAYGAVLGVGYGFRTDLLIDIPPFLVAALVCLPGGIRKNLGLKAAMVVTCAGLFLGTAWPVLRQVVQGGGCQFHVVLLGLDASFNDELGVSPSYYEWTGGYVDGLTYLEVAGHHDRVHTPSPIGYCTPDYDSASWEYLRAIVVRFPGDMITRAYGAVLRVTDIPFPWYDAPLPGRLRTLYRLRSAMLEPLAGTARVASVLAILMLGAYSMRLGVCALLFLLYFGGYPALQFANRHYFHLEFIGWWAMGFLVETGIRLLRRKPADGLPRTRAEWRRVGLRGVQFAVVAASIIAVPLLIARAYQARQVDHMMKQLLDVPRVAVPMETSADGTSFRLIPVGIAGRPYEPMQTMYLDMLFDLTACPRGVPITFKYDPAQPSWNFTHVLRGGPPGTVRERVLLPVYRTFQGFDTDVESARCVTKVERLAYVRKLPLLPVLTLPHDWQALPPHQTLLPIEWPVWLGGHKR